MFGKLKKTINKNTKANNESSFERKSLETAQAIRKPINPFEKIEINDKSVERLADWLNFKEF